MVKGSWSSLSCWLQLEFGPQVKRSMHDCQQIAGVDHCVENRLGGELDWDTVPLMIESHLGKQGHCSSQNLSYCFCCVYETEEKSVRQRGKNMCCKYSAVQSRNDVREKQQNIVLYLQ